MTVPPSQLPTIVTDRYTIEKEIGAGGMATVYLARDSKHDREVALKVLRPELGAVLGADRFLSEIKITARLDHPHILTLIDSGAADGLLYYVLPFVRGESLRDLLNRETQLSIEDAIGFTKQVGSALDYAHRHGVIHRDIKPENILIQEGEAILTDFGIALAVKEAGGSRLTETGLSLGTPQYMSPEQATGERTMGPKSDQYSLAAVLYEMLTGEPPLGGANSQAIIAKLLTEEPTHIRTVRKTVPAGIDAAVAKALSKSPADRFAGISEFLRALDLAKSATGTFDADAAPPAKSRKGMLIGGVAIAAVAVAAAFWMISRKESGPASVPIALRDRTQLTFTGNAIAPSLSSDGKQLAYFVKICPTPVCTYALMSQDVGSTEGRQILDGIASVWGIEWSPDRRNLLFLATYNGRYGAYLISALGGTPRRVGSGAAAFYAGGDSLLVSTADTKPSKDSTFEVKVTGLSGDVGGTLKIPGGGQGIIQVGAIPGSTRLIAATVRDGRGFWQLLDRQGNSTASLMNDCTCGGYASTDAVWMARAGASEGEAIVRVAIDAQSGKFAAKQDTIYNGLFTGFSVTADGSRFMVDDGTNSFAVVSLPFADMMARKFDGARQMTSSSRLNARVSPDGSRVLKGQFVPDGRGSTVLKLSAVPFTGGEETPIELDGRAVGSGWYDSTSVWLATKKSDGIYFRVVDLRNGAVSNNYSVQDSTIEVANALSNGWVYVPTTRDRIVIVRNGAKREIPTPPWYSVVYGLAVSVDKSRIMYWGWNNGSNDSTAFETMSAAGGPATHVMTTFAENAGGQYIPDGSFIAQVWETIESMTLTKIDPSGKREKLGTIPHPSRSFSHSDDMKRATLGWRSRNADAFVYRVVKQ